MSSPESKRRSIDIEKYLKKEKTEYIRLQREPKLLILGSSDSGKSTLLKQLKIIHGGGFTVVEREAARRAITGNIINAVTTLITECLLSKLFRPETRARRSSSITNPYHIPNSPSTESVLQLKYQAIYDFHDLFLEKKVHVVPKDVTKMILMAWAETDLQDIYSKSRPSSLPDTSDHFLNAIEKHLDEEYLPSDEGFLRFDKDILMVRAVTRAISDNLFEVDGKKLHFFDVSGLSYHRRAWLPYFMDVHTVLFVASLSSYDRFMVEDKTKNQMTDSLVLFDTIANHPLLKNIEFILFLNKMYSLGKIKISPLNKVFPEFTGKSGSFSAGLKFIQMKFLSQVKGKANPPVVHITCATDTKTMSVILNIVLYSIISANLKNGGITLKDSRAKLTSTDQISPQISSPRLSASIDTRVSTAKEIEDYLRQEKRDHLRWSKEAKVLLLGPSESGKSTLLKQFKIIYGSGFTDTEKELARKEVAAGILKAMILLLDRVKAPDVVAKYQGLLEFLEDWQSNNNVAIQASIIALSKVAWGEPAVQEIFARGYQTEF